MMIAICREVDKSTGKRAVYKIKGELTDGLLPKLQLRARANPELRYFATSEAHYMGFKDIITHVLKRKSVTEEDIKRVGGLVEL